MAQNFLSDIRLGDNIKIGLGDATNGDLRIYHNGADSYVSDSGAGNLILSTNGTSLRLEKFNNEPMGVFTPDGSVELYYDSSKKFETSNAGVVVTGNAYLTSGSFIHFDNGVSNDYAIRKQGFDLEFRTGSTYNFLSGNATFAGNIYPATDSLYDLGADTGRWANIYADNLHGDGSNLTGVAADESRTIILTVKNKSGGSLSKGTLVHASPSATPPSGNVIEVIAAENDVEAKMPALGVLNETLADEAEGECVVLGSISGISTTDDGTSSGTLFSIGDFLYVSDTAGLFTNVKPTGTKLIQKIGIVIKAHATNGTVEIFGAGRTNDVPTPLYIDHANQKVGVGATSPYKKLEVTGDIQLDATDANIWIKSGASGTNGFINWTFNSDDTVYNKIGIDYDTRATTGFHIDAGYPITIDGVNNINFHLSGSSQGTWDSTGLGIGTTSPDTSLHVVKDSSNSQLTLQRTGTATGKYEIYTNTNSLFIYDRGQTALRAMIDSSGNFGIGTTSPNNKLTVSADGGGSAISYFNNTNSSGYGILINTPDTNNARYALRVNTGAGTVFNVGNGGNVGIGTSSPVSKFETKDGDVRVTTLNSFSKFKAGRASIPSAGGFNLGGLHFEAYSTGTTYTTGSAIESYADGSAWTSTSTPSYLSFQTVASSSTSLTERMRIASDGTITLNAYGAGYLKTDANGVISVDTDTIEDTLQSVTDRGASTDNAITINNNAPLVLNGTDPLISFQNGASNHWQVGFENTQSDRFVFYDNNASAYQLILESTSGNATFAGNVGVGGAPSAALDITTAGNTADGTYYSTFTINNTGTSTWSRIRFDRSGVAKWGLALSTDDKFKISNLFTGGTTADPNDNVLVIDQDSNIGIGTDSPLHTLQIGTAATNGSYSMMIEGNFADNNLSSNPRINLIDTNFGITAGKYGSGGADDAIGIFAYQGAGRGILFAHTTAGSGTHLKDMRHDMFVDGGTGNVGINETAPAAKLQVSGDRDGTSEYVAILGEDGGATGAANSASTSPVHKTLLTGYSIPYSGQSNARLTSVGFLEFDSTPGWTGNQRNWALTSGYDMGGTGGPKFAILLGDAQNVEPQLGTNGAVGTGDGSDTLVATYWDNTRKMTHNGNATFEGTLTVKGDEFTLGDGNYEKVLFDTSPSAPTGNGSLFITPQTIPGSGTANFTTWFRGNSATGTTKHHVQIDDNLTVGGNLYVTGSTTSVNVEDLNVEQGEITLNYAASSDTSSSADGAGIRIQDAVDASNDATILWDQTNSEFDFSHGATFAGDVTVTGGDITLGTDSIASNINAVGDVLVFKVDSNENTGGSPNLQFKIGADTELTLNGSTAIFAGVLELPGGTLANPSIGSTGDTNTGMYWPGDHQLGFAVNGSRKFYMSETRAFFQNLSSGVQIDSSSDAPLEVKSSDATTGIKFTDNNANAKLYYVGSGNYFYTDAHRLGIGDITAPSVALHVVGTDNVSSRFIFTKDLTTDKILFGGADHDDFDTFVGSSSNHSFTITQNGAKAITIDTSKNATFEGDISLTDGTIEGTTTNADIPFQASNTNILLKDDRAAAANVGGSIIFTGKYNTSGDYSTGGYIKGYKENGTDDDYGFGLKFGVRTNGQAVSGPALTLDSSQNATFAGRVLNSYTGTSYHELQNATSNGTVLRLSSTGDNRVLYLQTDHIFSNGALYFGDNSYSTNFRGSSYSFSTGDATFAGDINIAAGKKLAYSSNSFITPENNVTGAEISTAGTFIVKTGTTPTLGLTLDTSQNATFAGSVSVSDGVQKSKFETNGNDLYLVANSGQTNVSPNFVFKSSVGGGTINEKMRLDSSGNLSLATATSLDFNVADFAQIKFKESGAITIDSDNNQSSRNFQFKDGNGSSLMFIGDDGSVGIGNTSPSAKLHIDSTGDALKFTRASQETFLFEHGTSGLYTKLGTTLLTGWTQDHDFKIYSNTGSQYVIFDGSTQRLGLGTTSPSTKLHIEGATVGYLQTIKNTTAGGEYLQMLAETGDPVFEFQSGGTGGEATLNMYRDGTQYVLISADAGVDNYFNNGSNVGIGTDSPAQKLHISSGHILLDNNYEIRQKDSGGTERTVFELDSSNDLNIGGSYAGALKFIGGGSYTEVMRIHDDGNVGIGTSSPVSTLEIAKNDQTNGAILSITNSFDGSDWTSGDIIGTINFRIDDVSNTQKVRGQIKVFDDSATGSSYPPYNAMSFSTANGSSLSERMRLDSSGNFFVSKTSDSVATEGFQVMNDSYMANTVNNGTVAYFNRKTSDGSVIEIRKDNSAVGVIGTQNWGIGETSPSGNLDILGATTGVSAHFPLIEATAQNTSQEGIHVTTTGTGNDYYALKIATGSDSNTLMVTNAGRVGIGTTSPASKLHVVGDTYVSGQFGQGVTIANKLTSYGAEFRTNGASAQIFFGRDGSSVGTGAIGADATYVMRVWKSDFSTPFVIKQTGNVGIGTTSPTHKLQVVNNGNAIVSIKDSGNNNSLVLQGGSGSAMKVTGYNYTTSTAVPLYLSVDGANTIMQANGGSVGIGTTSPQEKLHIFNSSASWNEFANIRLSTESDSFAAEVGFHRGTTDNTNRGLFLSGDGTNKHLHVGYTGLVGIGTDTPDTKLHLRNGTLLIDTDTATGSGIWMPDTNGNPSLRIVTDQSGAHYSSIVNAWGNSSNAGVMVGSTRNDGIAFQVRSGVTLTSGFANDTGNTRFTVYGNGSALFAGNVGIGAASSGYKLELTGSGHERVKITSTGNATAGIYLRAESGGSLVGNATIRVDNVGNINFYNGTSSEAERMRLETDGDLHVDGDVLAYSTTVSDNRLKDDVITIDSALDKVSKLRGVEYTWNATSRKGQKDIGVIAQEVEEVIPEIVREKEMALIDGGKYKTVDYEKLTAVLIEAVKELKEEVEELKNKCNDCTK